MYVQVNRLDIFLKKKYPKDYAPFQRSFWGSKIFSSVMRFIKSGQYIDYKDPELEKLCRSVRKLFNIFAGLCSVLVLIFLLT